MQDCSISSANTLQILSMLFSRFVPIRSPVQLIKVHATMSQGRQSLQSHTAFQGLGEGMASIILTHSGRDKWVSEWFSLTAFLRTVDIKVHIVYISHVIIAYTLESFRPRQNCCHFADDTFNRIFVNENVRISIKFSLKFVPKVPINNFPALVQILAWRCPGDKPLSEPMMVNTSILSQICWIDNIDGLVQDCSICSTLQILQSCTK